MDAWFQKAKAFAEETAKRSQELAAHTAKISQEFAQDTAKKSKELAQETAKKAEVGFKALVKELQSSGTNVTLPSPKLAASEKELDSYGITEELKEFVRGITLRTFKDFPLEDVKSISKEGQVVEDGEEEAVEAAADAVGTAKDAPVVGGQELTEWQEHHALLVLRAVPEIANFRYLLCPRRMTERRFWRIYFLLVHSHIAPYEARAKERAAAAQAQVPPIEEPAAATAPAVPSSAQVPIVLQVEKESLPHDVPSTPGATDTAASNKVKGDEQDLDAFLMDALGDAAEGEEDDDGDDEDFDNDAFDKFVNNEALDSDGEEKKTAGKDATSVAIKS